MMMKCNDLICT